jgi:hypothetical protein
MTTEYSKFESALLDSQEILTAKRLQSSMGNWKAATDLLQSLYSNCKSKGIHLEPIFAVVGIHSNAQGVDEIICSLTGEANLEQVQSQMKVVTSVTLYSLQCKLPNHPSLMIAYAVDSEQAAEIEAQKKKAESEPKAEAPVKPVAERPPAVAEPAPKKKEKGAKQASLMSFFKK